MINISIHRYEGVSASVSPLYDFTWVKRKTELVVSSLSLTLTLNPLTSQFQ
jgi:hypothetical protein